MAVAIKGGWDIRLTAKLVDVKWDEYYCYYCCYHYSFVVVLVVEGVAGVRVVVGVLVRVAIVSTAMAPLTQTKKR